MELTKVIGSFSLALLVGATSLAVAGCGLGASVDDGAAVGVAQQAIQGGYADTTDTGVVGVYRSSGELCSGTLIAPNVVVTARHCVAPLNTGPGSGCQQYAFGPAVDPSQMSIYTAASAPLAQFGVFPSRHSVAEVRVPDASDPSYCGTDIAILILQDAISASEATPVVPLINQAPAAGMGYSVVGYGNTCPTCNNAGTQRNRFDGLSVSCVGNGCSDQQVTSEWENHQGHACPGDSGGPALDAQGRLVGVTVRVVIDDQYQTCNGSYFTRVDSFGPAILQAVVDGAARAGYAPPAWVPPVPLGSAFASEAPIWPVQSIEDDNRSTCYSSQYFASSNNDRGLSIATWVADGRPHQVSEIVLQARDSNQGFPLSYDLYVTAPDNTAWDYVGTLDGTHLDANNRAVIPLTPPRSTYGISLVPQHLGVDIYQNHYFQLCDVLLYE